MKSGSYDGFTIDGKELVVTADQGELVGIEGTVTVQNLAADQCVELRGLVVFGTLAFFGLLALPVVVAQRRFWMIRDGVDRQLVAGLALITVFGSADLLPNGMFTHLPLYFAGALLGATQHLTSPAVMRQRREAANAQNDGGAESPGLFGEPEPLPAPGVTATVSVASADRPASLGAARRMR